MILDATTPMAFPNRETWGKLYGKFRLPLVNRLSSRYSYADREDAVEEAFHKLMHKKDMTAYGAKLPQTEMDWYWNLHWQARSFLSHIKSRSDIHAKYVETMSKELEDTFIPELQGIGLDSNIRSEALVKALEIFKAEQDISRRDLNIFILRERLRMPSKKVAARYNLTVDNVDVIKHRIGKLIRKYGRDCYLRALRRAA
jgi:DNA-directed RNA polymerase specialized sigma24 family protein